MDITVQGLTKRFGHRAVLREIALTVHSGELTGLIGPSGSGKTTLLRIIAGLDHATSGQVLFGGEDMSHKPVGERQVGFVFQHYALFRHMSVFENVAFGLRVRRGQTRPPEAAITERANRLLERMQIQDFRTRMPGQLSGGQRQRVALARALAIEPRVLLLDEPFGALDARVRAQLRRWLREVHDETGLTTIFVTHDQEEAFEIADRVVVLNNGQVEQDGTPNDIWDNPASPFVCEFLGETNRIEALARDGIAQVLGGKFPVASPTAEAPQGWAAFVRPQDIVVNRPGAHHGVPARVRSLWRTGTTVRLEATVAGLTHPILIDLSNASQKELGLAPGEAVVVAARAAHVFPNDGGEGSRATARRGRHPTNPYEPSRHERSRI